MAYPPRRIGGCNKGLDLCSWDVNHHRRIIAAQSASCTMGRTMSNFSTDFTCAARRLLPVLDWIPTYRREWLLTDVLSGVAIWGGLVTVCMASAGYVGVGTDLGFYPNHYDCV